MPRSRAEKPSSDVLGPPFIQLDYLYTPSADVAADTKYFVDVLGADVAFAVEGMGARVAMLRLTAGAGMSLDVVRDGADVVLAARMAN